MLADQDGVATLPQLTAAGMTAHAVRAQVDARRWTRLGDRCVVTHNAVPTRMQWMWVAVLDSRRFGLQPPERQSIRRDRSGGKRYLDCEWRLEAGRVVVLEVDGSHHFLVEHWEADMRRERTVVISGR